MVSKFSLSAFALAAVVAAAAMPATAASVGNLAPLKGIAAEQNTLVEQVHGWHKTCKRGFNQWHRHVPGVGRIQCTNKSCKTNAYGVTKCTYF